MFKERQKQPMEVIVVSGIGYQRHRFGVLIVVSESHLSVVIEMPSIS